MRGNFFFDETASFGGFLIFCFLGLFGVPGTRVIFGDDKMGQKSKKSDLGPRRGFSAKFSRDLKVAHGDSATDEPKKSGF